MSCLVVKVKFFPLRLIDASGHVSKMMLKNIWRRYDSNLRNILTENHAVSRPALFRNLHDKEVFLQRCLIFRVELGVALNFS